MRMSNRGSVALGVMGLAMGSGAGLHAAEKPADDSLAEVTVTGPRIATPPGMTTPAPVGFSAIVIKYGRTWFVAACNSPSSLTVASSVSLSLHRSRRSLIRSGKAAIC